MIFIFKEIKRFYISFYFKNNSLFFSDLYRGMHRNTCYSNAFKKMIRCKVNNKKCLDSAINEFHFPESSTISVS